MTDNQLTDRQRRILEDAKTIGPEPTTRVMEEVRRKIKENEQRREERNHRQYVEDKRREERQRVEKQAKRENSWWGKLFK